MSQTRTYEIRTTCDRCGAFHVDVEERVGGDGPPRHPPTGHLFVVPARSA